MSANPSRTPSWWSLLKAAVRGELRCQVPLVHNILPWRVGGNAHWLFQPADTEDVCSLLKKLPLSVPVYWLGLGSNTLIRDGGLPGIVILPLGRLNVLERLNAHAVIMRARGGVCPRCSPVP